MTTLVPLESRSRTDPGGWIRPVCLLSAVLATLLVPSSPAVAGQARIVLTDVASEAGLTKRNLHGDESRDYIIDTNGNGAAFLDVDTDGDLDVLLVNGSTRKHFRSGGDPLVTLYENDGHGGFTDVTHGSGLRRRGWGMGVCAADYDNDGAPDLYVTAYGPNVLFRNRGDGTFDDVTAVAGVGETHWSTNCAFADYDRDGDVDLYVANYLTFDESVPRPGAKPTCRYLELDVFCGPLGLAGEADVLYRNEGDGTFTDVTAMAGITDPGGYGFGVLFTDLDDDGWPDLFVANDSVPNLLFHNNGDGTFSEEGLVAGVALSADGREQAGMGVDAGDYDNDGDLDLVVSNFADDYNTLYQNSGQGFLTDVTHAAALAVAPLRYMGWGVEFVDIDNDGWLDVAVANGHVWPGIDDLHQGTTFRQQTQLFRNLGDGRFADVSMEVGGGLEVERASRGAAFGDYDNDGDIDMLIVNLSARPTLLRNDTVGPHHWVTFALEGTTSNRDGLGARVRVVAGGLTQMRELRSGGSYLSQSDPRLHFGLGPGESVDQVEIEWPSGAVDRFEALGVDRFYRIREGQGIEPIP